MRREDILIKAANGNGEALAFLTSFARRAHWVDDLADDEQWLNMESGDPAKRPQPLEVANEEVDWLMALAANQFFIAHRAQLVPAMILAMSAWVDSHNLNREQQAVVKGQWHEVVRLVAWLTGGWPKMRSIVREYDVEPVKKG